MHVQAHELRSPNEAFFYRNPKLFVVGQFWADIFLGIWSIFGQFIGTHFGTVSTLSMFAIIQSLLSQKTKPLYPHPKWGVDLRGVFEKY